VLVVPVQAISRAIPSARTAPGSPVEAPAINAGIMLPAFNVRLFQRRHDLMEERFNTMAHGNTATNRVATPRCVDPPVIRRLRCRAIKLNAPANMLFQKPRVGCKTLSTVM
jgi:hypothetical protein